MIYHITTQALWQNAVAQNYYSVESLSTEGFIHCCTKEQKAGVLERYYKGANNLLCLHIDESKLQHPLKYEIAPSINESFPHIYGTINIDAVVNTENIPNQI